MPANLENSAVATHKMESRLPGEISITSDDTTLIAESKNVVPAGQ